MSVQVLVNAGVTNRISLFLAGRNPHCSFSFLRSCGNNGGGLASYRRESSKCPPSVKVLYLTEGILYAVLVATRQVKHLFYMKYHEL